MKSKAPTTATPDELEALAARWDKVAFHAQGSPFEDLSVACLAKNSGMRPWIRSGEKGKSDTVGRYVYLGFDELRQVEGLDLRAAIQLLEICEATFLFERECEDLGSFEEISDQAHAQRMRFVEEFGLYQDFPVRLANLDPDLRELCEAEGIETFIELMAFLDRLSDKAWIGGVYKNLQNVFAHGDQHGLTKNFPFRVGHLGFHLPETIAFCLNRLPRKDLAAVREYHERRRKKGRLTGRRMEMPAVVEERLLPDVFECLHYFGRRQPNLLMRLHDSAYLSRELMYLNDPQTEGIVHWLVHLALGVFRPAESADVDEELKKLRYDTDTEICRELRAMLKNCG